ncbi:hypothetical protein [Brachybacterium vulturis]|uniref:hypothetical protein n=1 Tax=Brachybacterium vulturis TaxID=2017484 RepID=UPI003736B05E
MDIAGHSPGSPHGYRAMMLRKFEDCTLPLYGVRSTWQGFRTLAGAGTVETTSHSDGTVLESYREYELGHRTEWPPESPFLRVMTTDNVDDGPRAQLVLPIVDPERDMPRSGEDLHRGAVLTATNVQVDGQALRFAVLEDDHRFAAACRVGPVTIVCQGSGIGLAEVGLERITDLGPYIQGYTELFDQYGR